MDGYNYRFYDNRVVDIKYNFLSEKKIFLENMVDLDLKIFFIETLPNHNLKLSDSDFEFFFKRAWDSDFNKNYRNKIKGYEMPETIKILREGQSSDLMDFYDNLIAESLFIISKLTDNLYHFNMVVCVKSELELQNFLKKNFKINKINKISNITKNDLTYQWMSSTFNFDELEKFKNTEIAEGAYRSYNFNFSEIVTKEKIDYDNYEKYCMDKKIGFSGNPLYDWYNNEYRGKISEMQDQRFIFQNKCKTFGWIWFLLEYQFIDEMGNGDNTYSVNAPFMYIPHESEVRPFAIVDSTGSQKEIKDYEIAGMLDLVDNIHYWGSPFRFHFINVKWKECGTLYKQRLRDGIKIK